jgi:hypothetical protein
MEGLLRRPFPAQAIAIMGLAKRWNEARTSIVVAECGTGKTLIPLGAIHVQLGWHCAAVDETRKTARTDEGFLFRWP